MRRSFFLGACSSAAGDLIGGWWFNVGTSFDVLGFLFSHLSGGLSGMQAGSDPVPSRREQETRQFTQDVDAPAAVITLPDAPTAHRRNKILPLVSVMAADGRLMGRTHPHLGLTASILADAARPVPHTTL